MGKNCSHRRTLLHFGAVAASCKAFFQRTLADSTKAFTVNCLSPIDATTVAIDMLGKYGSVVQFRPKPCCFLSQGLVVVLRGDKGIALLTVEAAKGNHFAHSVS